MKTKQILFAMAIAAITFSTSCTQSTTYGTSSKNTGANQTIQGSTIKSKVELLTSKKWVLSETIYDGVNTISPCEKDNQEIFQKNGTCTSISNVLCPGESKDIYSKYWFIKEHSNKLVIETLSNNVIHEYSFEKLTDNTLILSPTTGIYYVYQAQQK